MNLVLALMLMTSPQSGYDTSELLKWREQRAINLKAEGGWLSVAGLPWLKEGDNAFGSAATIEFPAGAPAMAGTLSLREGKVWLTPAEGVPMTLNGTPIKGRTELRTDRDRVKMGKIMFSAIVRGGRTGVRIWDQDAESVRRFGGLKWFAPDPKLRVEATYIAYPQPKILKITSILGDIEDSENPGYVEFTREGKTHRLEAQSSGNQLFFNFKDLTNGKGTYEPGRFLYTDLPKDGKVVLDFNRAVNPPCNYTDFATCPLPPAANFLKVGIPAGEKKYVPK